MGRYLDIVRRERDQLPKQKEDNQETATILQGTVCPDETAPDGTYVFTNPETGQRFITYLYRCPGCNGTNWGPTITAPGIWHCLTCAGKEEKQ